LTHSFRVEAAWPQLRREQCSALGFFCVRAAPGVHPAKARLINAASRRPGLPPNYYVVRDANRQQLAYVYYENEPGRRSAAKLPDLLRPS